MAPDTNSCAPLSAGSCLGSGACGVRGPAATDLRSSRVCPLIGRAERENDFFGNTQEANPSAGGKPNGGTGKAVTSLQRQDPWVVGVLGWSRLPDWGSQQDAGGTLEASCLPGESGGLSFCLDALCPRGRGPGAAALGRPVRVGSGSPGAFRGLRKRRQRETEMPRV